jgi:hypothetical protein
VRAGNGLARRYHDLDGDTDQKQNDDGGNSDCALHEVFLSG